MTNNKDFNKMWEKELSRSREGYIMERDGVEIRATEKFVKIWEKRGFKIKEKKVINFRKEGE